VRLSDRLRAQYPETMTIILQHQFWDLAVGDNAFEVGLSFGGIGERLEVPFDAIVAFFDPAVQFGFQFEPIEAVADERGEAAKEGAEDTARAAPARKDKSVQKPAALPPGKSVAGKKSESAPAARTAEPPGCDDDKPDGGGEVVRLDRFRKK
jgi:uncharacterized protein